MARDTGELSAGDFRGNKLYEQRARLALPMLVRQAIAGHPIQYRDLAEEIGMPNPRNLNYVLGAIGNEMLDLGKRWQKKVPPIQALVINKATQMPGAGISWFAPDAEGFKQASPKLQREIVKVMLLEVFSYSKWNKVLSACGLEPLPNSILHAPKPTNVGWGGGEGENHRNLKEAVAQHPEWVGLPSSMAPGELEVPLRSGDSVDVIFQNTKQRIAIEVKGSGAAISEISRGLFQCVKYLAVLEAESGADQLNLACRASLAIGDKFPPELVGLRNTLGIQVYDELG